MSFFPRRPLDIELQLGFFGLALHPRKTRLKSGVLTTLIAATITSTAFADRTTILTWPETVRLRGDPGSTWVVNTSHKVKGEARAVYRCSVEIQSQITGGRGNVTVRLIAKDDESIAYQGIAGVSPTPLDFTTYTAVFIAHARTIELQAYYRLNRASGTASFRNLRLEKLTGDDAAEALKTFQVPIVHFSLPVYCYSDEQQLEWGYRINAQLNPLAPKVSRLELECAGRYFSSRDTLENDQWLVDLANLQLPKGIYPLVARALDVNGDVLIEESNEIESIDRPKLRKHLPIKNAIIDERNNLIVNGEPVLPMGLYHVYSRKQMRAIRQQGFNCIQIWGETPKHFEQLLDWAYEEGLMAFLVVKMVNDEYLRKIVTSFKNHPANLMWDLVDEPAIRNIPPESVQSNADLLRRLDPHHPIKISFADPGRAIEYKNSLDIVAAHTYPMPNGRVTKVSDFMRTLAANFGSAVPHHSTPQAWMNSTDMRQREQTLAQTRAMNYLSIIHGAKGLYYYSFIDHGAWYVQQHPRLWSTFKKMTWEIETLAPMILEGRRVESVTIGDPAIDFATWEYKGDRYLIAVNTSERAIETTITLGGSFTVEKLFTDEPATRQRDEFVQRFDSLQTVILKLRDEEVSAPDLTGAERPTAANDAAVTEEGLTVTIPVLSNDENSHDGSLAIVQISQPDHGAVSVRESLVGWWCFDENNVSEVAYDSSRSKNSGKYHGGMKGGAIVAGKSGRALRFDGEDDDVTTAPFPNLGDAYTVAVWVKDLSGHGTLVQHYNRVDFNDVERGWRLTTTLERGLITFDADGHNEIRATDLSPPLDDGNWHHIAAVKNGKTGQIYYDGKLIEDESHAKPTTYHPNQPIRMMRDKDVSGKRTKGTIDDVRIYDRALSELEVQSVYAELAGDSTAKPTLFYTLRYTPQRGFVGADEFSYTISNGRARSTANVRIAVKPRTLTPKDVRVCVTGYDHNRPDQFPGLGDFIGWAEAVERMPNGDILLVHSAGYAHRSFASPRVLRGGDNKPPAPTGGRSMATRSSDNGKTWSKPVTVIDHRLDDRPHALFVCRDGTVLCFVNVAASWAGFPKAPKRFENDLGGLNDQQLVLRSTDSGRTWSEPIWIDSPGTFYERAHGRPIQLDDGAILWATYCEDVGGPESGGPSRGGPHPLFGAIHRSRDSGKNWETISTIRLKDDIDEPAIAQLKDGRLIMVKRPDGGILYSEDRGVTWTNSGRTVKVGGPTFRAPQVLILKDGTIVVLATWHVFGIGKGTPHLCAWISTDDGLTWSRDGQGLAIDTSTYGYPGAFVMEDGSIMVSYCESATPPNRVYVVRIKVNDARDSIEFLRIR